MNERQGERKKEGRRERRDKALRYKEMTGWRKERRKKMKTKRNRAKRKYKKEEEEEKRRGRGKGT